jgi:hypothetical protein
LKKTLPTVLDAANNLFIYTRKGSRPRLNIQHQRDASSEGKKGLPPELFFFCCSRFFFFLLLLLERKESETLRTKSGFSISLFYFSLGGTSSHFGHLDQSVFFLGGNITSISCKSLDYNDGYLFVSDF